MVIYHLQVQIQVWEGFSTGNNGILLGQGSLDGTNPNFIYDTGNPSKFTSFCIVIPPEKWGPIE